MITYERVCNSHLFRDLDRDTLAKFRTYHKTNPEVYEAFKRFAFESKRSGKKHYGAKAIMERARYHCEIERKTEFKINNNFTAYYARLLALEFSEFEDFFELRTVKGLKEAA